MAFVGVALEYWESDTGMCEEVNIVLWAVTPRVIRAREAERRLVGRKIDGTLIREVAERATEEASPITDVRGSDWYQHQMVRVLVERGLRKFSRNKNSEV